MAVNVKSMAQTPPTRQAPQAEKSHPLFWVAVVILTSIGTTTAVVAGIAHFAPRVFLPPAFKAATDYVGPVGRLSLLGSGSGLVMLTALSAGYLSSQKRAQAPTRYISQQIKDDPPFIACVKTSPYKEIEASLEKAENLNEVDHLGHTALWHAVQRGSSYVHLLLQQEGIDVNLGNPLQAAARLDDWVSYELLRDKGADESQVKQALTRTWKALTEKTITCMEAFDSIFLKEKDLESHSLTTLCAYIRLESSPKEGEELVEKYIRRIPNPKALTAPLMECGALSPEWGDENEKAFLVFEQFSSVGIDKKRVLFEAARKGYHHVVAKLIEKDWLRGNIDEALNVAKENGHYRIVKMLENWQRLV